jgi:hypothetical protein
MKVLLLLVATAMLSFFSGEKKYFHRESVDYSYFSIRKEWSMNLNDNGIFQLKYLKKDSRFDKKVEIDFLGTWVNNNDTIFLKSLTRPEGGCAFITAKYILCGDSLKALSSLSLCLPSSFEASERDVNYLNW